MVGVIGGVSSASTLGAFGNRCSCTDAKLRETELRLIRGRARDEGT